MKKNLIIHGTVDGQTRKDAQRAGHDTDINRDYEYTDWVQVQNFVSEFVLFIERACRDHRKLFNNPFITNKGLV